MADNETSTTSSQTTPLEPKIIVEHGKGRWSNIFHIVDSRGHEAIFTQAEACGIARRVLNIATGKD